MTAIEKKTAANKRRFLRAFEAKSGNVRAACAALGMPRSTHYFWRETDPAFDAACAAVLEDVKDNMESQLILIGTGVKQGSVIALLCWLNARARDRGYGTSKIEHGGKLSFVVVAAGDPPTKQRAGASTALRGAGFRGRRPGVRAGVAFSGGLLLGLLCFSGFEALAEDDPGHHPDRPLLFHGHPFKDLPRVIFQTKRKRPLEFGPSRPPHMRKFIMKKILDV